MEPGHVHYRIAGEVLKGIQRKAAESGIELDVGEVPNVDTQDENGNVDPERLTKIVARIIARGGDRISVFRRISRHLEGQDKRSGLLSDITAAVIELYKRNPDTFHDLGKQAATDFNARRVQRAATKETPQTNGGMSNASR